MIRIRHIRGSILLATAAAAALAACGGGGDDKGSGGGDGDGDGDGDLGGDGDGDGDGDLGGDGDGDTGGNSGDGDGDGDTGGTPGDGDGDTGGTPGDGDGDTGGAPSGGAAMGGMGGMGGMPSATETLVDDLCPDASSNYMIIEGTEGVDVEPDVSGTTKTAVVAGGGNDVLGYVDAGPEQACILAGDGNDTITITGIGDGTSGAPATDVGLGYIVLGDGADVINYEVNSTHEYAYRGAATVADFESGIDKLRFELEASRLPSGTVATGVLVIENFDQATPSPVTQCQTSRIVIDPTDGEVWYSSYCEGTKNELLMVFEGETPELSDIEIYYRDDADTPALAADQVCQVFSTNYTVIVEGTENADTFSGANGLTRTLTLGYGADDVFSSASTESSGAGPLSCQVGGDGADTFNITHSLAALAQTELFGGDGIDIFAYSSGNDGTPTDGPGARAVQVLRDFTSGVDQLRFSQAAVQLASTDVGVTVEVSSTDFTNLTVQAYQSCSDYKLVIDQTDGEVWLSRHYCESTNDHNMLLFRSLGDVPTPSDIVIY